MLALVILLLAVAMAVAADVVISVLGAGEEAGPRAGWRLIRLFFRQLPPTGTLRRVPPRVQQRLQALQKCLGWERL